VKAFGEFATRGTAAAALRPGRRDGAMRATQNSCFVYLTTLGLHRLPGSGVSGEGASSAERWAEFFRLAYMSCSVDLLGVQIRVLLALASPTVQVGEMRALSMTHISSRDIFKKL
jgi:hypothetical protein